MAMEIFCLKLNSISSFVHLGCLPQERYHPQEVRFGLEVRFLQPPKAISSDELTDSVCYTRLAETINTVATNKEYKMIEHLANEVLKNLRDILPISNYQIRLRLHKVHPPHALLAQQGVELCLGDF